MQYQVREGIEMRSVALARKRRTRLAIPVIIALFAAIMVVAVGQAPKALASVTWFTFAGNGTSGYSGDGGAATSAELNNPGGISVDAAGNVFILDEGNRVIREVTPSGTITTTANSSQAYCNSSNVGNTWSYDVGICSGPSYLASAPGGGVYLNNGGWFDEIQPDGVEAHVAGKVTGSPNYGTGSSFGVTVAPNYAAVGSDGTIYFSDSTNSIKALDLSSGQVTMMAGTSSCSSYPNVSTDNGANALGVCIHPYDLTVWGKYLYFFDNSPGLQGPTLWRIDTSQSTWVLTLIAGNGTSSTSGNGGPATSAGINTVGPIAVDTNGSVFIGNLLNGQIREINTSGTINQIAAIGHPVYGLVADASDNLYATEGTQNIVEEITGADPVTSKGTVVVLGDSVPAGEGINYGFVWDPTTGAWTLGGSSTPSWSNTTTALGSNYQDCHQSGYSYPRLLADDGYTVYNMACTGASALSEPGIASNYTNGGIMVKEAFGDGTDMPAELGSSSVPTCSGCDSANSQFDTNLGSSGKVILQVGADDIDFGDWLQRCYTSNNCGSADQSTLNSMLYTEEADLRTTISELNSRAGADGYSSTSPLRLVVVDYYNPYGSTFSSSCLDEGDGGSFPDITSSQQTFIVNGLDSLDGDIKSEVQYAQSNDSNLNVTMVDLAGLVSSGSAVDPAGGTDVMMGHTLCSSDPWVYGPSIDYPDWAATPPIAPAYPAPMHPTSEGQEAIYSAIVAQAGF